MNFSSCAIVLWSLVAANGDPPPTVGPVTSCPDEVKLCEPIAEEKKLPDQWSFWTQCDTFVGAPVVEFVITADGTTSEHRFLRRSGCEVADKELLCWIKKWRYRPAQCGDEPIAYKTTFKINWHPGTGQGDPEICVDEPDHTLRKDASLEPRAGDATLTCSHTQNIECKKLIERIRARGNINCVSKLATIVYEEWNMPISDPRKHTPRLACGPGIDIDELRSALPQSISAGIVIVKAIVEETGNVKSTTLIKKSKYEIVNEKALEMVSASWYRPALDEKGRFKSEETLVSVNLHVH